MEPTSQGRSSVNIGSTVAEHRTIAPHQLQPMHSLGVALCTLLGIGKTKVVNVLEAGKWLNHQGTPSATLEDVFCEPTIFVAAGYGQKCEAGETMTEICHKVCVSKQDAKEHVCCPNWKPYPPLSRHSRNMSAAQTESLTPHSRGIQGTCLLPKLKALPPTLEAFKEHVCCPNWKPYPPLSRHSRNMSAAQTESLTPHSRGIQGTCLLPKLKALPPTLEAFKEHVCCPNWKPYPPLSRHSRNMSAAQTESLTPHSRGIQGTCLPPKLKALPPTLEAFKEHVRCPNWKPYPPLSRHSRNMSAAQTESLTPHSRGIQGTCLLPKLKALPPTLEAFKEHVRCPNWKPYPPLSRHSRNMSAAQTESLTPHSRGIQGTCLLPKLKALPPTLEAFKEHVRCPNWKPYHPLTRHSNKHKESSLSGMHMESCFGWATSKSWSIIIWLGQR